MSKRISLGRAARVALWVVAGIVVGLGLYARFRELGARPLAFDEYYFIRSVENLLANGFPAFETGGYYVRGLLVQYLTAGSIHVFGSGGFAFRLPAVLFGVLAAGLAYVYARFFVGRTLAACVAGILLLSSWQIEFARFARMYTAFEAATLGFLICVHWAYFEDRWERRYWPHLALLLCVATHSLSVLLAPALFLPLVVQRGRAHFDGAPGAVVRFALAGVVVGIVSVLPVLIKFRNIGVDARLPEGFEWAASGRVLRGALPIWAGSSEMLAAIAVVGVTALLGLGWIFLARRPRVAPKPLFWILFAMVASAAFHQFALCGLLFVLAALRYDLLVLRNRSRGELAALAATAALGVGWFIVAFTRPEVLEQVAPGNSARALRLLLFGFPDYFTPVYAIWRDELPIVGALALVGVGAEIWRIRTASWDEVLAHPGIWLLYVASCFGVLYTQGPTTRYAFFVYPLVWTVVAMALQNTAERVLAGGTSLTAQPRRVATASVLALAGLFLVSDDFQAKHLMEVDSPHVRWRLEGFSPYEAVWFWRYDFESPGHFLKELGASGSDERVVVVNQPPVSYYLDREHAVYIPRSVGRFNAVSRERGTVDLWSNERLLSTFEDVRSYTQCDSRVWLVRHQDPRKAGYPFFKDPVLAGFDESEVWGERLISSDPVFVARDGRLAVFSLELAALPGAVCDPSTEIARRTPGWSR